MGIGLTAILVLCAVILAVCRAGGVNWFRSALATVIGGATAYFSFGIAFRLRLEHDLKLSPHDGQSGMDVLAFAILTAPAVAIIAVLLFLWITRSRKPTDGS